MSYFPPIATDGRQNPLSPDFDPNYTAASAFSDAVLPEPRWVPVCGRTSEPMDLQGECAGCGCWDR